MNIVRGVIAALFLAAIVGAGILIHHKQPVHDAGQVIGYVPPVTGQKVLVLGDSFSVEPTTSTEIPWAKAITNLSGTVLENDSVAGSGYAKPAGPGSPPNFPKLARTIVGNIHKGNEEHPDWIIVWAASDDVFNVDHPDFAAIESNMVATLKTLKPLVAKGHLIVVGPAGGPAPGGWARYNAAQQSAVAQVGLQKQFIDPIDDKWFDGQNAAFIGANGDPTGLGQSYVAAMMQGALSKLKPAFQLFSASASTPAPEPPLVPTIIDTETHTQLSVSKTTVSVTPHTSTVVKTQTVQAPPVVVTVTVAPTQ